MEKIWLNQYQEGVPAVIDLREFSSLADMFRRSVERNADKTAFISFDKSMSYRRLDVLSRRFASYLVNQLDLNQGDRIALMIPNLMQYPVAFYAACRAGIVVVNIDPLCTQSELRYQLKDSGCRAVVLLEDCARRLSRIIAETDVESVIVTQVADLLGPVKRLTMNSYHKWIAGRVPIYHLPNSVSFSQALRSSVSIYADPIINAHDLALLQYTSGTEGVPKGVMLSHQNLYANVLQASAWTSTVVSLQGTALAVMPFSHIFGFTANFLFPIRQGACSLLVADARDCESIVKIMEKNACSSLVGVSTLFNKLLEAKGFEDLDFSELKICLSGGMPIHKAVARNWSQVTGCEITECYGMTETSPAITANPLSLLKYSGYLGVPLPSTEISIRDMRGNELNQGAEGELWARGPQVMLGYWKQPQATYGALCKDGWFRTGDVAMVSETGMVKVIDRLRDIVNVSGFVVYPSEVEKLMLTHESVEDVAAVGLPDDRSGEVVKLFVVGKDGFDDTEALHAFCKIKLSGYKRPKEIEFVEKIPRFKSGRLLRRELRKPSST
ncbi:AMP-binding protein [Leucothrix arctica]|uniref:Long-chain-fatty-acid--CoA ligase n=1 Tax=Leucothrix arctica TaxID=1481894 RepID=A0A317CAA8_9GAMM|nr:AMP-binding protein [Leucothrix arctica]PWQ95307.1 long-chain-fatty-acid--CoA ligase [Leucothrix arctica]